MRIFLRKAAGEAAQDQRLERLRRVLRAARRTVRYQGVLEAAGLASEEALRRLRRIEDALWRLPRLEAVEFDRNQSAWCTPDAAPPPPEVFYFPAGTPPRTAIVLPRREPWFRRDKHIRVFEPVQLREMLAFEPEAIAAPAAFLVFLARLVDSGYFPSFPALTRGLVAFTGVAPRREGPEEITSPERDLLWEVFRVPVFQQYLGLDGRRIAWECEAREGLHVEPANAVLELDRRSEVLFTSLTDCQMPTLRLATRATATVELSRCPCGHPTPRLAEWRALPLPVPARAAYAAGRS
jgi:hypothetical protein